MPGHARTRLGGRLQEKIRRIRARLPVYLADLWDDPKWLLMFAAGRIIVVRRARMMARRSPLQKVEHEETLFPDIDSATVARELRANGISCGIVLPDATVRAIRAFAERTACFAGLDRRLALMPSNHRAAELVLSQPILVGHYLERIEQCPEIAALRRDPRLLAIAARYLDTTPIVISSRLWWSFPATSYDEDALNRASQERFHFDMNDWRSVKFFFYLTDVDETAGPHVYVRESHRIKRLRHQLTLFVGKSAAEIVSFYGTERIQHLHGRAGYGFAEDPFGFHMGTVALGRPRLMFEVEYGVSRPTRRRYYGYVPTTFSRALDPASSGLSE